MAVRSGVRFKADDIWDAPDDENRYEVIDGELFMTSATGWKHQSALGTLHDLLGPYVRQRGLGRVVPANLGVVLDEETAVQPDLVYISRERMNLISERGLEGAPDLVVEVLSPRTRSRDRGVKMRRYARAGVPNYWIMDPESRALEAYGVTEQGYNLLGTYGPGSTFRPALFPGLEIPIDELWA